MVSYSGNFVLYAKSAMFEYDEEDGTIHTVIKAYGMEARIIQNRNHFMQTGIRADKMRKRLAAEQGRVVDLSTGKKPKH